MPSVPLPTGYVGIDDLPKQREMLINLVNLEGSLARTPGIESLITAEGTGCRGATTWFVDECAYFVLGGTLYRLEHLEILTALGSIAGTTDCVLSGGQVQLVVLVKGGPAYTYDRDNGLIQITDPNFLVSVSVDFIDGRHIYIPADGSPAFFSEVDRAGEFNPLSFFDGEEMPDLNRFVINLKNMLFIMGSESTEIFTPTGIVEAPFSRRSGSRIDIGYVSGGTRFADTFAFIGKPRDQSYAIYVMGSGAAQQISNPVVTEDINAFTDEEIEACKVNRFKWYGMEFLCFSIADRTYVFCNGNWLFMDSDLNGTEAGPWRANGVSFANGKYYVGDRHSNNIGILTKIPSEYGENIEYQLNTFLRTERGENMRPKMVEVDVLTGQNATTLGLALSRDGRVSHDYHYRSLGRTGEYQRRVRWHPSGGLGRFESYMGMSLRGTGQVNFGAESIYVS